MLHAVRVAKWVITNLNPFLFPTPLLWSVKFNQRAFRMNELVEKIWVGSVLTLSSFSCLKCLSWRLWCSMGMNRGLHCRSSETGETDTWFDVTVIRREYKLRGVGMSWLQLARTCSFCLECSCILFTDIAENDFSCFLILLCNAIWCVCP